MPGGQRERAIVAPDAEADRVLHAKETKLRGWIISVMAWLVLGGAIAGLAQRAVQPHQWPPRIQSVVETPAPYCFERFDGQALQGSMWIDWAVIEVRSGDTVVARTVADAEGRFSVYLPVLPAGSADVKFFFVGFWRTGGSAELPVVFE